MEKLIKTLSDGWRLAFCENRSCREFAGKVTTFAALKAHGLTAIPAAVPGSLELDLFAAGLIEDPFFGDNAWKLQKLENLHAWYACEFDLPEPSPGQYLEFAGLDTAADLYLNGELIRSVDNMFLCYEVPAAFRRGKNELLIHFKPACIEARRYPLPASCYASPYNYQSLSLRKAAHMFGWDIMPRIVSLGIWKPVSIKQREPDAIRELFLYCCSIDREAERANCRAVFRFDAGEDFLTGYRLVLRGVCGDSRFEVSCQPWHTDYAVNFTVENCQFWWPKPYGRPALYQVTAELWLDGALCDTFETEFGIRTMELLCSDTTDREGNGEFAFRVNGERIFALGTNWVPLDAFHSNDRGRLEPALELLEESGCNMVRCWGGNVYESDEFFTFCDRQGILVWQDFAMGCAVYPGEEAFFQKIREEAEAVVKRLRNHASLALWAGDNECDLAYRDWNGFRRDPNRMAVTRRILPEVLELHDFTRPYLPSSPFVSEKAYESGGALPEDHLWGPRDYFKGDFYRNSVCHFASETGYHGCPSPASLRRFIGPEKLWPCFEPDGSPNSHWLCHAAEMQPEGGPYAYRIRLMADQAATLFGRMPEDLETFSKMSQISQAEAKKYFIERFRLSKWRRSGIIWWNLLDGWPQISDAVVDYYFTKKLAFSYIKRSQTPICLMCGEPEGSLLPLYGVNDTLTPVPVSYRVENLTTGQTVLTGRTVLAENAGRRLADWPVEPGEQCFYLITYEAEGREYRNHYFTNLLNVCYEDYLAALQKAGMEEWEGF